MSRIRYVLMIVIDPKRRVAIGLKKTKGPEFLIGKITFPGGKAEGAECPAATASRELLEEAGVFIPAEQWRPLAFKETPDYELRVLLAVSTKVHQARQMEEEPVFELDLLHHHRQALAQPEQYTPDFLDFVEKSAATLGLELGV